MSDKIGLVLTGGGARGAYQVGVTRAIYEIAKKKDRLFEVISGNSAGALNSTYLASNAENWDVATRNLMDLWLKLRPQAIYDLRGRSIADTGFKLAAGTLFGGLTKKGSHVNHLLDTAPLKKLIKRELDFPSIGKNIEQGRLHGISLSTTNYHSGSSVVFYQGHSSISDWIRSDRFSLRQELNADHLMASAAIPFFFPPVKIGSGYYGDGCIRQTTPLSPAIHLGADKIVAIGIRHPHQSTKMQDLSPTPIPAPTIGQITGVMMNAIFLDSLEADVERLRRINELVLEGNHPELKHIPIFMIRPSRDLGKMTEKLDKELPKMLRYLLKGIGVSGEEGLDLLSYLAFDSSYTRPLVELGYEDTFAQKDELLKFIDA